MTPASRGSRVYKMVPIRKTFRIVNVRVSRSTSTLVSTKLHRSSCFLTLGSVTWETLFKFVTPFHLASISFFFPHITFLQILCEFHIIHPESQFLPRPSMADPPCDLPPKRCKKLKFRKKKSRQSLLCVIYILTGTWSNSQSPSP